MGHKVTIAVGIAVLLIGKSSAGSLISPIPKQVPYPLPREAHSCLDQFADPLDQESTKFFCKRLDSKYIRLCELCDFCCNYSSLPLLYKIIHRTYVHKWVWLCSVKTLFTKTGSQLDWAKKLYILPTLW